MTRTQRRLLERFATGDLPLRRAIAAALCRLDELERETAYYRLRADAATLGIRNVMSRMVEAEGALHDR